MAVEVALLKAVDLLVGALKYYVQKRRKSTDRSDEFERRERLVSEAIRELLSRRPNVNIARARIEEARSLGNQATEHLLRAEELLDAARKPMVRRAPAATTKSKAGPARSKKKLVRRRVGKRSAG